MRSKIFWFLKNDLVFWIFFLLLSAFVFLYILKKEGIKITVDLGQTYGNKVFVFGN